ncbi:imidazoleglycerol-phosphate dehydratase [Thalassobacillus devorans]|uniref:imidazoleglycerol-phosphate dehydratase n=1 Tax=Thalassobacillus devorans TaxID=279813 RepID=UPI000A1CBDEA|nr:imidazoleglycerol-phosphate dehydratase [Thalassobacillus devorans]
MTSHNGSKGSKNQSSPKRTGKLPGGKINEEFGKEIASGDQNKGKEYRSKKGPKAKKTH